MTFKDKAFCSALCSNWDCDRNMTVEEEETCNELDLMVSYSDFSEICGEQEEPNEI